MSLAIVGARLLDARSERPLDGDVLVVGDDGRIASIARGRSGIPDGAATLDAAGATVTPGLIDCHVHFFGRHERLDDALSRTYTEEIAESLRAGEVFLGQGSPPSATRAARPPRSAGCSRTAGPARDSRSAARPSRSRAVTATT
jgi:imidazolonepropionase-like amidohydrolase